MLQRHYFSKELKYVQNCLFLCISAFYATKLRIAGKTHYLSKCYGPPVTYYSTTITSSACYLVRHLSSFPSTSPFRESTTPPSHEPSTSPSHEACWLLSTRFIQQNSELQGKHTICLRK
ncbi:hypothetical protein E2C01_034607 [Portunus trituberculatus]|uniref:Uncharacterized protein n=1 Tax=Portunus trituberculatus TaxID=210409 RepID=A0A5B7F663_PORTR|nr:hypothetical protein [Portunus trituberculatus]